MVTITERFDHLDKLLREGRVVRDNQENGVSTFGLVRALAPECVDSDGCFTTTGYPPEVMPLWLVELLPLVLNQCMSHAWGSTSRRCARVLRQGAYFLGPEDWRCVERSVGHYLAEMLPRMAYTGAQEGFMPPVYEEWAASLQALWHRDHAAAWEAQLRARRAVLLDAADEPFVLSRTHPVRGESRKKQVWWGRLEACRRAYAHYAGDRLDLLEKRDPYALRDVACSFRAAHVDAMPLYWTQVGRGVLDAVSAEARRVRRGNRSEE